MEIFDDPQFGQHLREEFDSLGCRDYFLSATRSDIPEECKRLLNSVSYYAFEGGLERPCECDVTGSESTLCDKYSGQCPCNKNVMGRRCDMCYPGTYGFGADGCKREYGCEQHQ